MSFKSTTFTRRTFLGGLAATVAAAATPASSQSLTRLRPLEVAALVDGPNAIAELVSVIQSGVVELQTVLASSNSLVRQLAQAATPRRCRIAVFNSSQICRDKLPSALLVLGRWEGSAQKLRPLISGKDIYIDDPPLAQRLASMTSARSRPRLSLVGLTAVFDPAVDHAGRRLESSVMGEIKGVAVSIRKGDWIGPLEAAAVLQHLVPANMQIQPHRIVTRNVRPAVHISCTRGQLVVPLFSKEERLRTLPFRLQHFISVVHGEAEPAISLKDMVSLSEKI